MGLMTKVTSTVKSLFGEGGVGTFTYRCGDCDVEFGSQKNQTLDAECPECESDDIRPVV